MTHLVNQPTAMPTRKVTAAGIGAAFGSIAGHFSDSIGRIHETWTGWLLEPDVKLMIVTAGAMIGAWAAGYFVRERAPE